MTGYGSATDLLPKENFAGSCKLCGKALLSLRKALNR